MKMNRSNNLKRRPASLCVAAAMVATAVAPASTADSARPVHLLAHSRSDPEAAVTMPFGRTIRVPAHAGTTLRPSVAAPSPARATTTSSPNAHASAGSVNSFWLHLNSTPVTDSQLAEQARLHDYIVLNAWEGGFIPKLKASNPTIRVFVYKDLSSTRSYACRDGVDDALLPAGVGYCFAARHHPEWFLTSRSGQRLQYDGYAGHWQMDVSSTSYQEAWADNVIRESKANGFDGVFMDNALFTCDTYHSGVCPAKYPTDAAIRDAYLSMLGSLRPRFSAAGLLSVANLSNARLHAGVWDSYMRHLDGGFDEWWLAFSDDNLLPEYDQGWSRQVAEIAANEANGKITWVQPHFGENGNQARRYALASYFMATGGKAAISSISQRDGYGDPSPRLAAPDLDLGAPLDAYYTVQQNVFRRDFSCGTVVVNARPTRSAAVTVPLGRAYTDESGRRLDSVSLRGTSGAVLRGAC